MAGIVVKCCWVCGLGIFSMRVTDKDLISFAAANRAGAEWWPGRKVMRSGGELKRRERFGVVGCTGCGGRCGYGFCMAVRTRVREGSGRCGGAERQRERVPAGRRGAMRSIGETRRAGNTVRMRKKRDQGRARTEISRWRASGAALAVGRGRLEGHEVFGGSRGHR